MSKVRDFFRKKTAAPEKVSGQSDNRALSDAADQIPGTESNVLPATDVFPEEDPRGRVRVRWHGIHPVFIVIPIVVVLTAAVLLVIYFTTRQTAGTIRTTLYVNNLLPVAVETENEEGNEILWGYLDKEGTFAIDAQFLSALDFASNGLAAVETADGWGYIDRNGNFVVPAQYEGATTFSDSGYAAVKRNGSWGYIKKDGTMFINPQFDEAYAFTDEGLALVKIGGKYGYINRAGVYVIVPRFENAESFQHDGTALVFEFNYWGMINSKGEYVINPQFDSISWFAGNKIALVSKEGKYGYIDKNGVYAIAPTYDYAEKFSDNGLALVKINDRYGYINKSNELVLFGYADAKAFGSNGLAPVQAVAGGTWQYIDRNGDVVFQSEFSEADTFFYGMALVRNTDGNLSFINEKEECIFLCPEDCVTAIHFSEDEFAVLVCFDKDGFVNEALSFEEAIYYTLINKKGDILLERIAALNTGEYRPR